VFSELTTDPDSPIADGADRQLDPRSIPLQQTIGWIVTAVVSGLSLFPMFIVWAASGFSLIVLFVIGPLWLVLIGLIAWHGQRWPPIEYRHASYRVDERGIEIRKGVYWRKVINVPRSRVQHTDVAQGPLERKHGLATLVIYTAGTDHAKVGLSGLDHATALRIREHLLPTERSDAV
jgi:uncharacterized protein